MHLLLTTSAKLIATAAAAHREHWEDRIAWEGARDAYKLRQVLDCVLQVFCACLLLLCVGCQYIQ
jgi:hypothetical protein